METTKKEYRYLEIVDNVATTLLTLEQAYERTKTLTTPAPVVEPKPDYIALQKRVLVGTKQGRNIYTALIGGVTRLIDQVSTNPDAFFVRGFNFDYTPTLGAKPSGEKTDWDGKAEPAKLTKPAGYRLRFSPTATSDTERFYELSDLPDEVFVPKAVTKPTNPIVVTPTPDPPKGNQNVTTTYTLGDLLVGSQAQ